MLKNVKVTNRDVQVLKDIHDNSFLSFYQIHEEFFPKRSKSTVYNRLSKLIQAGIIEALNVNLFCHHRNNETLGVIYRMTKKGIEMLNNFYHGEVIHLVPPPINLSSLYHDLLLVDAIRILKKKYPDYLVTSSKLNAGQRYGDRIPDAVLYHPSKKMRMAFELELTAKSDQRYRDIVLSYRTSLDFEKVLYVVKDESIHKKIGGVITGYSTRFQIGDDTDKFDFNSLRHFLNDREKTANEL